MITYETESDALEQSPEETTASGREAEFFMPASLLIFMEIIPDGNRVFFFIGGLMYRSVSIEDRTGGPRHCRRSGSSVGRQKQGDSFSSHRRAWTIEL